MFETSEQILLTAVVFVAVARLSYTFLCWAIRKAAEFGGFDE